MVRVSEWARFGCGERGRSVGVKRAARRRFLVGFAIVAVVVACETGTEPLEAGELVGTHELVMVDGFHLPIDVWFSGKLTLSADSTYVMVINDAVYDSGSWTTRDNQILVSSTKEPEWVGFLQPHAILFAPDVYHYNYFLFEQETSE